MYVCMHVFIHSPCPALSAIGVHISWSHALLSQVTPVHCLHFTCICGWTWDALLGELHILRVSFLSPPVLLLLLVKRAEPSGQTNLPPSHNPPKRSGTTQQWAQSTQLFVSPLNWRSLLSLMFIKEWALHGEGESDEGGQKVHTSSHKIRTRDVK